MTRPTSEAFLLSGINSNKCGYEQLPEDYCPTARQIDTVIVELQKQLDCSSLHKKIDYDRAEVNGRIDKHADRLGTIEAQIAGNTAAFGRFELLLNRLGALEKVIDHWSGLNVAANAERLDTYGRELHGLQDLAQEAANLAQIQSVRIKGTEQDYEKLLAQVSILGERVAKLEEKTRITDEALMMTRSTLEELAQHIITTKKQADATAELVNRIDKNGGEEIAALGERLESAGQLYANILDRVRELERGSVRLTCARCLRFAADRIGGRR